MKKALVTGATGFIGKEVCRELSRRGIRSAALLRPGSGATEADECFEIADPCDAGQLTAQLDAIRPSMIFHLAGARSLTQLDQLYRANVFFAAALIEALANANIDPVLVLAGSASEYGPIDTQWAAEDHVCRPITAYGISKLAQTHHAMAATHAKSVVARIFNPIGPHMPTTLALGRFAAVINSMTPDGGILETGSLDAVRDVSDVAEIARCLVSLAQTSTAPGRIVNVCSGKATSLRDLTQQLILHSRKPIRVVENYNGGSETRTIAKFIGNPERLASLGIAPPELNADRVLRAMVEAENPPRG